MDNSAICHLKISPKPWPFEHSTPSSRYGRKLLEHFSSLASKTSIFHKLTTPALKTMITPTNVDDNEACELRFGDIEFTDSDMAFSWPDDHFHMPEERDETLEEILGIDTIPQESNKASSSEHNRTPNSKMPDFLIKLHAILSNDANSPYIDWKYGTIVVKDPIGFEKNVLPAYFNHSKFSSK